MNYVKSFDFFGVPAAQIPSIPGSGAPTTATEGAVGCLYMDTDTGNLYKCTAVEDGVYTWVEAEGSGGGLNDTARALLITILRNGVYSTDQSANITALEAALASGGESGGGGDSGGDETHTHSYTASVTTAATCETAGIRTYTCSCGHSYTEAIPATGHNYVSGVCANCGAADPDADIGGIDWVSGAEVAYTLVDGEWANDEGEFVASAEDSRTDYIYCYGAGHIYHSVSGNNSINVLFYDINKNLIYADAGYYTYNVVPENAAYVVVSWLTTAMTGTVIKLYKKVEPTWTDGEPYVFTFVENEYINNSTGEPVTYSGWKRTDYVNCVGVTKITKTNASANSQYNCFYNADKEKMTNFTTPNTTNTTNGAADIQVPAGACYFMASDSNASMDALVLVPYA